jgi:hypothetical protein
MTRRLSLLPAYPSRNQVCLRPSCSPRQHGPPVLCRRPPALWSTAMRATYVALLQGPSLRSGFYCPGPSTLNRPHPPHSQAHHNFAVRRLICDAFAVRERLGDPRAVPRFTCSILPSMSFLYVPGEPLAAYIQFLHETRLPSPTRIRLGTPNVIRFRGLRVHHCYDLLSCSPPYRRLLLPSFQRIGHPPRCRISLRWQLDNFHRRDSHPLDRRLASLHSLLDIQIRTY